MDRKAKIIYPELSYKINGCIFEVYNQLGPNHREKYYQKALAQELKIKKLNFIEQTPIDVKYKNLRIGRNFLDFLVEEKVVIELKASSFIKKEYFNQVLSYLKIYHLKLGIIAAFGKYNVKLYRVLNDL